MSARIDPNDKSIGNACFVARIQLYTQQLAHVT